MIRLTPSKTSILYVHTTARPATKERKNPTKLQCLDLGKPIQIAHWKL